MIQVSCTCSEPLKMRRGPWSEVLEQGEQFVANPVAEVFGGAVAFVFSPGPGIVLRHGLDVRTSQIQHRANDVSVLCSHAHDGPRICASDGVEEPRFSLVVGVMPQRNRMGLVVVAQRRHPGQTTLPRLALKSLIAGGHLISIQGQALKGCPVLFRPSRTNRSSSSPSNPRAPWFTWATTRGCPRS